VRCLWYITPIIAWLYSFSSQFLTCQANSRQEMIKHGGGVESHKLCSVPSASYHMDENVIRNLKSSEEASYSGQGMKNGCSEMWDQLTESNTPIIIANCNGPVDAYGGWKSCCIVIRRSTNTLGGCLLRLLVSILVQWRLVAIVRESSMEYYKRRGGII